MLVRTIALASAAIVVSIAPASAALVISSKATTNVTCTAGVCEPTAKAANLNVTDLQTMLAGGDISVLSSRQAKDIDVRSGLSWASTHALTLDAHRSIAINAPIAVQGAGGLTLTTNDHGTGGTLNFGKKGSASFLDTSSSLVIDGVAYKLEADFVSLSADIANDPGGNFAWARDYDATADGVYTQNPVTSILAGNFEGLGNNVQNLKITNTDNGVHVGMFYEAGSVSHFHLAKAHVRAKGTNVTLGLLAGACGSVYDVSVSGTVSGVQASYVGGACGVLSGNMDDVHSSASVKGNGGTQKALGTLGGLVGFLDGGEISKSYATGKVTGDKGWVAGGLVGYTQVSTYTITQCYATGLIIVGDNGVSGGLMGSNAGGGTVNNSYATGYVGGGVGSTVGGFIGINNGPVSDSYSSGAVTSGSGNAVGGLIGNDLEADDLTDTYWDTTTSGQSHGVGNDTGYPGVTGLTTEDFQAGLPTGLDPAIWVETPDINGGLPYLRALPPQ